jgi:hypothetical protein
MAKTVYVLNDADFARTYRDPETGEKLTLYPGRNKCSEVAFKRMKSGSKRFADQLAHGSLVKEGLTAISDLVDQVKEGMPVAAIEYPRDAIAVVAAIDDIAVLERMYMECRRVSVRTEIVKRLRLLGYEGT